MANKKNETPEDVKPDQAQPDAEPPKEAVPTPAEPSAQPPKEAVPTPAEPSAQPPKEAVPTPAEPSAQPPVDDQPNEAQSSAIQPASVSKPQSLRGQISLRYGYRGELTGERWIEPGIYAVDDPALFGLAQHLIDNGHAVKGQVRWEQAPE